MTSPPDSQQQLQNLNQQRMQEALNQQQHSATPLSLDANGRQPTVQTNAPTTQSSHAQQAHTVAAEQIAYAKEFQKHSLQRVTHLAQQNRFHEDQLHLLNLTSHVHNAMKNRRNVATCVELSTERAKSLSQEELYKALLVYMERKGYTPAALNHVRSGPAKCTGLSEYVAVQTFEYKASAASNHMLQLLRRHEDPAYYEQQYLSLQQWATRSLDVYKGELTAVLFPVFAHVYIYLHQRDMPDRAQMFMAAYRADHENLYAVEIEQLSGVSKRAQLVEANLVREFLTHKLTVWMSRYSFETLTCFLEQSKLILVLHILTQYVDIQVFEGTPNSRPMTVLTATPESVGHDRSHKWGALEETRKPHVPSSAAAAAAAADAAAAAAAAAPAPGRVAAAAAADPAAAAAAAVIVKPAKRARSQSDAEYVGALVALSDKVRKSDTSLPSTCCYMFQNTHDCLTSAKVSRDGRLLAACFSDASVRVWDTQKHSPSKDAAADPTRPHRSSFHTDGVHAPSNAWAPSEATVLRGHCGAVYDCAFRCGHQSAATSQGLSVFACPYVVCCLLNTTMLVVRTAVFLFRHLRTTQPDFGTCLALARLPCTRVTTIQYVRETVP
jgi:hypothetical protein